MKRSKKQTDLPVIALIYIEEEGIPSIPLQSVSITTTITSQRRSSRRTQHKTKNDSKAQAEKKNVTWYDNQNHRKSWRDRQNEIINHERKNERRSHYSRRAEFERRKCLFNYRYATHHREPNVLRNQLRSHE